MPFSLPTPAPFTNGLRCRLVGSVVLAALLALVTGAGCNQSAGDKKDAKAIVQLVVAKPIAHHTVQDYQDFTGRLDAYRTVDLKARVSGYLINVPFKEGDVIHKDDLLFQVDPKPYQADLNQADADLKVAIADLSLQEKNADRARQLILTRGISKEDYDTALAAQVKAEATVGSKRASRDKAQLYLDYCTMRAPLSGRISKRFVDPFNLVNADMTMLAEIVTIDPVYAYFDVDERTYLDLQKRATPRVLMRLATENTFVHKGIVDFIDNKVNSNAGTLRMRGIFDYVQGLDIIVAGTGAAAAPTSQFQRAMPAMLYPGLFCRVQVPVGEPYQATLVPDAALQTDQGKKFIYVFEPTELDASGQPVLKTKLDDKHEAVKDGKGEEVKVMAGKVRYLEVVTGQQVGPLRVILKFVPSAPTEREWVVTKGQQRVRLSGSSTQDVEATQDAPLEIPASPWQQPEDKPESAHPEKKGA